MLYYLGISNQPENQMKVFYTPSKDGMYPSTIDGAKLVGDVYVGIYSGETLEQIANRYPGALLGDAEAVTAEREGMMISDPKRITKESFWSALECLPPEGWVNNKYTESFKMCEYYSGIITSIYARFGDSYWTFKDVANKTHADIMNKVSLAAINETHQLHGRTFKVLARFEDNDEGTKQANAYMTGREAAGVLEVADGWITIASKSDIGVPA